jgi:hypothetical protein
LNCRTAKVAVAAGLIGSTTTVTAADRLAVWAAASVVVATESESLDHLANDE